MCETRQKLLLLAIAIALNGRLLSTTLNEQLVRPIQRLGGGNLSELASRSKPTFAICPSAAPHCKSFLRGRSCPRMNSNQSPAYWLAITEVPSEGFQQQSDRRQSLLTVDHEYPTIESRSGIPARCHAFLFVPLLGGTLSC